MGSGESQRLAAPGLLLLVALLSCTSGGTNRGAHAPSGDAREETAGAAPTAPPEVVSATPEAPERTPLGSRRSERLDVPGHVAAPLFVPQGGAPDQKLRVFMIAHGAGGRGIDHCTFWDPHLPPDVVLVCLAGALLDRSNPEGGAYFPDHFKLREELVAVTSALKARLGERLVEGGWRFIGYSQGATMGALALVGESTPFTELVLIEGGGENWTARRTAQFKEGGGTRVLLACGTNGCAVHGKRSATILEAAGLEAMHVHAPGVGHTYSGGVGVAVYEQMMIWE